MAPNSPQRAQVTALARQPPAALPDAARCPRSPRALAGALSSGRCCLARIYEILPLRCALCGAEMRLIAFVTDAAGASKRSWGTWASPPPHPKWPRARGPPLWDPAPEPLANWDEAPAPVPEFVFDQRLSW